MSAARYPDEAVVFEIIRLNTHPVDIRRVGDHVEGAGPCCVGTDREWRCGVLTLNGESEEDGYFWAANLRPLTPAARAMLRLVRS